MAATGPIPDMETLLLGPGLRPPPGVIPNFIDPYSIEDIMIATIIVCITISTVLVTIRMYARSMISKSIGVDDWTCLLAYVIFLVYCILGAVTTHFGAGVHQWNVQLGQVIKFGQISNPSTTLYSVDILMIKLSILLQYLHIFVPSRNRLFYLVHFIILTNSLFYVAIALVTIFECNPREKIWRPYLPGHCVDFNAVLIVGAGVNIVSDFAILALPIGSVWRLQMKTGKKVGLSAVFGVGLFACVASIMRLERSIHMTHSQDLTYDLVQVYLWTLAEIASGILCCCLPVLPQFFHHFAPKIASSFRSRSSGRKKYSRSYLSSEEERDPSVGPWVELGDLGKGQGRRGQGQGVYAGMKGEGLYDSRTRAYSDAGGRGRSGDGDIERAGAGAGIGVGHGGYGHGGIKKTTTVQQDYY